jgi:NitT/TauT family transport system substrate-binding protein
VGLDVTILPRQSGKGAITELADGQADFATASDTPIMFALLKSTPVKVIATLAVSSDNTTLVTRRDSGINTSDDLPKHRVGFAPGTTSQHFLDTFLEYRGLKSDSIERIPLKPEEMIDAIMTKKVDVISIWNPINYEALTQLGENGQEIKVGNIYRWSWHLVAGNQTIAKGPIAPKLLMALMRATEDIRRNPKLCAELLSTDLKLPPQVIQEMWTHTVFDVTLDQSVILNLEQQARWAITSGLNDIKEVPNFLPGISSEALRSVDSEIVSLVDGKKER